VRRQGGRLEVDAPHGARLRGLPAIDVGGRATALVRIGRGVDLGRDLTLDVWPGEGSVVEIGDGTTLGRGVRVQLRGGRIAVGARCQLRDGAFLKADGELRLGELVVVGAYSTLAATESVVVGDRVGLGERCSVTDSDHAADGSDTWYLDQPLVTEPVLLGDNVLVGAGVAILKGSRVGANAVLAAGAVLAGGEIPPRTLAGGVPARVLKELG